MDIIAEWLIDTLFFLQYFVMYFMYVVGLFYHAESSLFCNCLVSRPGMGGI
jgi:hypothetical protein